MVNRLKPWRVAVVALAFLSACESPPRENVSMASAPRALSAWTAGELIGRAVYNRAAERIGTVNDVVVHRRERVTGVVLGVGGTFFGIGESEAVVPLRQFRLEGERLVVPDLTRDTLDRVDNYHPRDWDRVDRSRPLGTR